MAAVNSPGLAVLQELAWLRKNAALRSDVPTMQWATVVTGSPHPTVLVDHTTAPRQVSANAAGWLTAGDRVRVELQGTRTTAIANANGYRMHVGVVDVAVTNQSYAQAQVMLPEGLFTDQSRMVAVGNATNYDTKFVVRTLIFSVTQVTIGVRHIEYSQPQTATVPVAFIVAQT